MDVTVANEQRTSGRCCIRRDRVRGREADQSVRVANEQGLDAPIHAGALDAPDIARVELTDIACDVMS